MYGLSERRTTSDFYLFSPSNLIVYSKGKFVLFIYPFATCFIYSDKQGFGIIVF